MYKPAFLTIAQLLPPKWKDCLIEADFEQTMPKYICAYGSDCPTYGKNGGQYYRGLEFPFFTFHDGPCHFCEKVEEEEMLSFIFHNLEDLIDRQDMADKAHYERARDEQTRKEHAAKAERW